METKVIGFSEEGDVGFVNKEWDLDEFSDFSYRHIICDWVGRDVKVAFGSNGICTENFQVEVPWQLGRSWYETSNIYWWGEDLIKKFNRTQMMKENFISGACPFVYTKEIYTRPQMETFYQAVFLPKTDIIGKLDFDVSTTLNPQHEERQRLQDVIYGLDWTNPLFICTEPDMYYYADIFPEERLFCLGVSRNDNEWNDRLVELIQRCDTLYFQMISTPAVYSSYIGRKVKFYDTSVLQTISDNTELYTLDKTKKSDTYFEFLNYIHEVFETRGNDMDFWIRRFLSLDRILPPSDLLDSITNTQKMPKATMRDIMMGHHDCTHLYPYLAQKVSEFNRKASDDAVYYYNLL
jgi:hypothetical protein